MIEKIIAWKTSDGKFHGSEKIAIEHEKGRMSIELAAWIHNEGEDSRTQEFHSLSGALKERYLYIAAKIMNHPPKCLIDAIDEYKQRLPLIQEPTP